MEKKQRIKKISHTSDRDIRTVKAGNKTEKQDEQRAIHRKKRINQAKRRKRRRKKILIRLILCAAVCAGVLAVFYIFSNFSEANKLNTKGLEAYEQADYETALSCFSQAIGYDDNNSGYYVNQGLVQSELKMYDAAMASFEQALECAHQNSEIQLVHRAKGISLLYQGKYADAVASFDEALAGKESRFTNTEIDILYYKAETQDKAGSFVDAVLTYSMIVDETNSADAYMLRGMEYVKVGDHPSAESDLRTAIKKDKKNYDIYLTLYQALMAQNKTQEASEALQEALKLGGSKGTALVSQGEIYMKLGDLTSAKEKFEKALEKKEITANLGLAQLCLAQTTPDYATASQYYETYLESVTNDAEAYNEYGLCLMKMENYKKAEEIFTRGVALNDRLIDRTISKNQISAAEHAGNWESALEYINVYLTKYSDDSTALKEKDFILTRVR